jgi:chromosome segregation ATPase
MRGVLKTLTITLTLLIWMTGGAYAQDPVTPPDLTKVTGQQANRRQTLEANRVAIERMREELLAQSTEISRRLASLQVGDVTEAIVEQAQVDTEAARLRQQELQAEIAGTERRIKELEQSIRDLEAREQLLRNPARAEEDVATRAEQLERTRQALAELRSELML